MKFPVLILLLENKRYQKLKTQITKLRSEGSRAYTQVNDEQ